MQTEIQQLKKELNEAKRRITELERYSPLYQGVHIFYGGGAYLNCKCVFCQRTMDTTGPGIGVHIDNISSHKNNPVITKIIEAHRRAFSPTMYENSAMETVICNNCVINNHVSQILSYNS